MTVSESRPLGEQLRPSQKLTSRSSDFLNCDVYCIVSTCRRHSLGDIRDIEGCNYIHISALESEVIICMYVCMTPNPITLCII